MVVFALLARWMQRKDAAQSGYQQYHSRYVFSKGVVWAGLVNASCVALALVGAVDSTFALPHLEWPAGALTGACVPLALVYARLRFQTRRKPMRS
jgi:hypothetical protein